MTRRPHAGRYGLYAIAMTLLACGARTGLNVPGIEAGSTMIRQFWINTLGWLAHQR